MIRAIRGFCIPACISLFLYACAKQPARDRDASFEDKPVFINLSGDEIAEASGMADSYTIPGHLWVHEDSGNPPVVYLLSHTGELTGSVVLKGAINRDWEELATGPGPKSNTQYVYIAETGDNNHQYDSYSYLRFTEPQSKTDTIREFETIHFKYPDGSHDSEAFFIDRKTRDIYVITKREIKARVYKLPYPQSTDTINTAAFILELPYSGVVGCSLSGDGNELLIKTYPSIYYYSRSQGESIEDVLQKEGKMLGYETEVQGEAIAFANNGTGFFTLSEKAFTNTVRMHFYKRK